MNKSGVRRTSQGGILKITGPLERYSGARDRQPFLKGDELMRNRTMKVAVLAATAGTLLQLGGCLGVLLQQAAIQVVAGQIAGLVPDLGLSGLLGGTTNGG